MIDSIVTIQLTGMAHGGDAVGRHEGRAVFVRYGIPGETVRVKILQNKGHYLRAEMVEVLEPSPNRVQPHCKYFGKCGGCYLQHMNYETQLESKRQVMIDVLSRLGALHVTVHPTLPSPNPYNYRSHVTFRVNMQKELCFTLPSTDRFIMPVEECHIIRDELSDFSFHSTSSIVPPSGAFGVRAQIGSTGKPISFPWDVYDTSYENDEEAYADPALASLSVNYTIKGHTFRCSAGSFFQVNLPQAEKLVELILEGLDLKGSERVLDLYSGVGLFTAFLAERAKAVVGVESFSLAVEDAAFNLDAFDNVELYLDAVENVLPTLEGKFDAAVIDPPRAGMAKSALAALIDCKPTRLVYVSCNPATLARDAKKLVASGYRLHHVQPVDMFPQTFHIESVSLFTREGS